MISYSLKEVKKERLKRELYDVKARTAHLTFRNFVAFTMPKYKFNWHHELLIEKLDKFSKGEIKRLMIFAPPRHGKSELVSRRLPAYIHGLHPDKNVMACSYGAELASQMNSDVQKIMTSQEYLDIEAFKDVRLNTKNVVTTDNPKRNSTQFDIVNNEGTYRCAGVGGPITGFGFHFGIIDDPVKNRKEADSGALQKTRWRWYTNDFHTRCEDGGSILLTLTRWTDFDIESKLLELQRQGIGDDWEVIVLPAIQDAEGVRDYDHRRQGEALWPEKKNIEELILIKNQDPSAFAALYQQRPSIKGGELIKESVYKFENFDTTGFDFVISYRNVMGKEVYGLLVYQFEANNLFIKSFLSVSSMDMLIDFMELYKAKISYDSFIYVESNKEIKPHLGYIKNNVEWLPYEDVKVNEADIENNVRAIKPYLLDESITITDLPGNHKFVESTSMFPNGSSSQAASMLAIAILEGQKKNTVGSRLYVSFDKSVHVSELATFNPYKNFHCTFDQNLRPYFTQVVAHIEQLEGNLQYQHYRIDVFDEVLTRPPHSNATENAIEFNTRYKGAKGQIFLYGDSSLKTGTTLATGKITGYKLIEQVYDGRLHSDYEKGKLGWNPPVSDSVKFVNLLLEGKTVAGLKLDFRIHPNCTETIKDFLFLKSNADGGKLIEYAVDKDGNKYEKWGHCTDSLRYLIIGKFMEFFDRFRKKDNWTGINRYDGRNTPDIRD